MKLQLRHLHYFIAVAEQLNFREAGEKLNVSQPTLSLQIAQLEEILGVRLLKRDKRHVSLTEPGELFYKESLHILSTVEQSVSKVRSHVGSQPLTIGVPNYHSFDIISEALHTFSQSHPNNTLSIKEMTSMDMYEALNNESLDVGFMSLPLPFQHECKLNAQQIDKEPYLICLSSSHPAYERDELDADALKGSKFFLLDREVHPSFYDMIVTDLSSAGFDVEIVDGVTSTQAQYSLVAAQMGVCLALKTSPLPQGIKGLPLNPQVLNHNLALIWHPNCKHESLQPFIKSIVKPSNLDNPTNNSPNFAKSEKLSTDE